MQLYNKIISVLLFSFFSSFCDAQITTSSLYGVIYGSDKASSSQDKRNYILYDAQIKVINEVSGLEYEARTDDYGRFLLNNILPGGPYTVKVSYPGYGEKIIENTYFSLGTKNLLELTMNESFLELSEKALIKTLQGSEGITTVTEEDFKYMPSSNRNIQDFSRFSPYFNFNSYAGNNFRYNNVTLDGAINNDALSFISSTGATPGSGQMGTAGSGSQTSAYSLDAIKQLDVFSNAYDIRLGNFAGASINTITRTGTNKLHGSVYSFAKDAALTSFKGAARSTYSDLVLGASISGAIVPNKIFFFINGEITRKSTPSIYNIGSDDAAIDVATATAIKNRMLNRYGIDLGETGVLPLATQSQKLFARIDYNINKRNKFAMRAIINNGFNDNLERSSRTFQFGAMRYQQRTSGLSFAAELNSSITSNLSNNLILGFTRVNDYREQPETILPFISIGNDRIWAGNWREASVFNQTQRTYEITNNLTWHIKKHNITLGTHNEFYDVNYSLINSWNGRWEYATVTDFLNDKPSRIRNVYNLNEAQNGSAYSFENAAAPYKWAQIGVYLQDEITLGKLTITPGIRVENDFFERQPEITAAAAATKPNLNVNTFNVPAISQYKGKIKQNIALSPRIGFKYDVKGNENIVLRGGSGIFTSRFPLSWYAGGFDFNGKNFGAIDYRNTSNTVIPIVTNPLFLADSLKKNNNISTSTLNSVELDIIDPNLKTPTFWRSSFAIDIKKSGWEFGIEGVFSKTIHDVLFQNLNQKDSSTYFKVGPTQSPNYLGGRLNTAFSGAYLMTNTKEGYRYNISIRVGKEFDKKSLGAKMAWSGRVNLAYAYGRSFDISNGIRNSYSSNFEANPALIPNAPALARSNFELRHNIVLNTYIKLHWNKRQVSSIGIFANRRSGSPYSLTYGGLNFLNNGINANLLYIPKDRNDISLVPYVNSKGATITPDEQWTALDAFVTENKLSDKRGLYVQRNALTAPAMNFWDMRLSHEFGFKNGQSVQLSFDIFNVFALFGSKLGEINFVSNTNNYTVPVLFGARDASGNLYRGKPGDANYTPNLNFILREETPTLQNNEIMSSWQGQLGLRFSF